MIRLVPILLALLCSASARTPNVVVIFIDDMGYADIGPFGAEGYETPNLDRHGQRRAGGSPTST